MSPHELTVLLKRAFYLSVRDLALAPLVSKHLRSLTIPGSVNLIAAGKGAPSMALGALHALAGRVRIGLVVTTDGTPATDLPSPIRVLRAAHPIADSRSLSAATEALQVAQHTHTNSTLVVLVSGGASSLLCAPPKQISLQAKNEVVDALLRAGANIRDVNTVRRHFSRIKGGRLALATNAPVICVIASDVVSGGPHDVGSGPACPDPTSAANACTILATFLEPHRAQACTFALTEGLKTPSPTAERVQVEIVVRPQDLAQRLSSNLRLEGFCSQSQVLPDLTADDLASHLVETAQLLPSGHSQVMTCEPTVRLPANAGLGGRAGWVALRAVSVPGFPKNVVLLAAASDGLDGSSKAGGACIYPDLLINTTAKEVTNALATYSDATIHAQLQTGLPGKPTGINLTDVYVVAHCH